MPLKFGYGYQRILPYVRLRPPDGTESPGNESFILHEVRAMPGYMIPKRSIEIRKEAQVSVLVFAQTYKQAVFLAEAPYILLLYYIAADLFFLGYLNSHHFNFALNMKITAPS